ncbi:MAG: hypothetical protein V2B14_05300 [bacterium]
MKIFIKQYYLDKPKNLTVEYIENFIIQSGFEPLRWAIVKFENNKLIVDAVVIS